MKKAIISCVIMLFYYLCTTQSNQEKIMLPPPFQILVIDREPSISFEFQILMQLLPIEVHQVCNGLEAMKRMTGGFLPDMIFADADMDLISASQLIRIVKSNGFLQDIPVVGYGYPEQLEDLQAMNRVGAMQYIFKPLSISDIQDCLIWEMNQVQI